MNDKEFYAEIIEVLKQKKLSKQELAKLKSKLCKKYNIREIPTDIQIITHSNTEDLDKIKLVSKPTRSISGVTPVAIMSKPMPCPHGKCIYCPGGLGSAFGDVPQSYTGHEPATMRGIRNDYDAYLQVFNRLEQFSVLGHSFDKIDLIIMGGTFPSFPKDYQEEFVKYSFKAMNDFSKIFFGEKGFNFEKFKDFFELPGKVGDNERINKIKKKLLEIKGTCTLEEEQLKNESSNIRCIGLTIETKPDCAKLEHANEMLRLGCTRVELGVQSVYEDVIKKVHRGHTVKETIESIRTLKDLGFKINAHYMPGLPLTDKKRDLEGMKELFSNPDFRPDMLKIYPCMVSTGTTLYKEYKAGKFKPMTTEKAAEIIAEFKKFVPEYCRIMRVQRDVPTKFWESGVGITNLRQYIHEKYKPKCRCIRCREPRGRKIDFDSVEIKIMEYDASKGKEFFISAEDVKNDIIVGFCRLRIPSQSLRNEITTKTALIRELHVYGSAVPIGEEGKVQHQGWGRKLMNKAEEIAKQNNIEKVTVISGVGVRPYYYKIGYEIDGPYVSKNI